MRPDEIGYGIMKAHLVGSMPLADSEAVFRTLAASLAPFLRRMPDGETGIRQSWIRYLQDVLAAHPAIEVAQDLPPFRFVQWNGELVREIPRLRIVHPDQLTATAISTGYADMAIGSWAEFAALQQAGVIAPDVRFQICLPTPTAPTYNNMLPADRALMLRVLGEHFRMEINRIASELPNERIAIQWDVCQEVLAWENYYEPGPVDFKTETIAVLADVCGAVPAAVELGIHLCYLSSADERDCRLCSRR
jgi:hypothetical protein